MATLDELRRRTEEFLTAPAEAEPRRRGLEPAADVEEPVPLFSTFLPDQARRASEVAATLAQLADQPDETEGIQAALDHAEQLVGGGENPRLVQEAMKLFITHTPHGWELPIPPVEASHPGWLRPSEAPARRRGLEEVVDPERALDWYREDRGANEHHTHWHVVYPVGGVPTGDPNNPLRLQDRQGEIFFYMHRQMLARYDTERVAVGLAPVVPLAGTVGEEIPAYEPGIPGFTDRPPGKRLVDVNRPEPPWRFRFTWQQEEDDRRGVEQLAGQDEVQDDTGTRVAMTPSLLGHLEEATLAPFVDEASGQEATFDGFGSHHNIGHMLISFVVDPTLHGAPTGPPPGVMATPVTAIRDPVFYQWHRHVDDVNLHREERLASEGFGDPPPVRLRKELTADDAATSSDLIVVFRDTVPEAADDRHFDWQAWGKPKFGGANWDTDFSSSADPATTDRFETMMLQGDWAGPEGYLDHREFVYFVRAENVGAQAQPITVRTFLVSLAPAADGGRMADDRRYWIELDKFSHTLGPGAKDVIARPGWLSSVVMKEVSRPPEPRAKRAGSGGQDYCNCGWPYNLLLPRGTVDGMPVRLLVMLTDGRKDAVGADEECGSISYCGSKDKQYPDARPMGYPFARRFEGTTPSKALGRLDSVAMRDMSIVLTQP